LKKKPVPQAIFKFIDGKYKVGEAGKTHLRMALKRGVDKKELVNPKGHGGSYRLAPKVCMVPAACSARVCRFFLT
jgi:hypothetical protein